MTAVLDVPFIEVGGKPGAAIQIPIPEGLTVQDEAVAPKGYGMFRIMTKKDGDKRVVWNNRSLPEIQAAKSMFDSLSSQGLTPYKVGSGGKASSAVMDEFDPLAEEVIFLPMRAVAGG